MACKVNHICFMSLPSTGLIVGYLGIIVTVMLIRSMYKKNKFHDLYNDHEYSFVFFENLITSVLLIIGTKIKSALMVFPWVFFQGISLGAFTYYCLYCVIGGTIHHQDPFAAVAAIVAALGLFFAVIGWYVWLGIFSLFGLFWEERNGQPQCDKESQPRLDTTTQPYLDEQRTFV